MKLYNLSTSVLILSVGAARVRVEPFTFSSSIVLTPSVVKSSILPVINMHGENILLVPNSADSLVFEQPGCGIPARNLTDDQTAMRKLNKAKSEFNKKNKDKVAPAAPPAEMTERGNIEPSVKIVPNK